MTRLNPIWSQAHNYFLGILLPVVFGTLVAASNNDLFVATAIALLLILTAVSGLAFDAFVSLVLGFSGAALCILMKRVTGVWPTETFLTSGVETLFFLLTGLASGIAGIALNRVEQEVATLAEEAPASVLGTMGFLTPEIGEARLEEEIERAHMFDRPLSVLRVRVVVGPDDETLRDPVSRSVMRPLESLLRLTDIPFAYTVDDVVAVLPETTAPEADEIARRFGGVTGQATFLAAGEDRRRVTSQHARVLLAVAALKPEQTTEELLEETSEDLRRQFAPAIEDGGNETDRSPAAATQAVDGP